MLYATLTSPVRATCTTHLILLALITLTILGEEYKPCGTDWIVKYHVPALKNSAPVTTSPLIFTNLNGLKVSGTGERMLKWILKINTGQRCGHGNEPSGLIQGPELD
jgi:hypothetical protein